MGFFTRLPLSRILRSFPDAPLGALGPWQNLPLAYHLEDRQRKGIISASNWPFWRSMSVPQGVAGFDAAIEALREVGMSKGILRILLTILMYAGVAVFLFPYVTGHITAGIPFMIIGVS